MDIETKHLVALVLFAAFGSAGIFATLVSQRARDIALFGLVVGAAFMQKFDITLLGEPWYRGTSRGIELSLLDVGPLGLLLSTLLLPRYARGRFFWPASLGLMLIYFLYCCFSVANADPQIYGIWELSKMARGIIVLLAAALFIRTSRELKIAVLALACAVWIETVYGFEQRFLKGLFRVPGTLGHENTLSTYLCAVTPVLLAATLSDWPKWLRWFTGITCLAATGTEFLTLSRAGVPVFVVMMTGTAVMCTSWRITWRKLAVVTAALVAAGVFLALSWDGLKIRYQQSNLTDEFAAAEGMETRGMYWRIAFAIVDEQPFGIGLNNWSYHVSKTYGPRLGYRYEDYDELKWAPEKTFFSAPNHAPAADALPALTLGELGWIGFGLLLLVFFRWLQMGASFLRHRLNADPMHRIAIGCLFGTAGIFLQSSTEWTYKQPAVHITFHVIIGVLASLYYARRHAPQPATVVESDSDEPIEVEAVPMPAAMRARI